MSDTRADLPVLSIIVPTRNRTKYVISCIRSVLGYPSDRFELIVQDNSDDDELDEWLRKNISDARMKYHHARQRLNITENFTKPLERASGTYITYFGDDDGANPELIDAAVWADANKIDVLTTTGSSGYTWPDKQSRLFGTRLSGKLDLRQFTGKAVYPDPELELRKCAKAAGALSACSMPLAYRGIVRRECLEKLKAATGTYFPGPSPDLAVAIGLAGHVARMCQIDYPLFLPGDSSGNAHSFGRADYDELRLETKTFLSTEYVQNWSQIVPAFFSGPTVWGETAVQALKATGREDILRDFNVPYLHSKCVAYHPALFRRIIPHFYRALRSKQQGYLLGTILFVRAYLYHWTMRTRSLARNARIAYLPNWGTGAVRRADNIEEAVDALSVYLGTAQRRFDDRL